MDSYPDPGMVGKAFVKQYYTQMHKDPSQMHRFYLDQSSFVHGGSEMGSEDPVIGQKSIHDKIVSLGLKQVHAKIKQVDSHSTLGNGIVIQVTGELSTSGHPMRAFVQTFVLAPESPKKYYVHNDIFRYQDDDLESETNDGPGESETLMMVEQTTQEEPEYPRPPSSLGRPSPEGTKEEGLYVPRAVELSEPGGLPNENAELEGEGGSAWDQYGDAPGLAELQQNGITDELREEQPPQEFPMEPPLDGEGGQEEFPPPEGQEQEEIKGGTWASRLMGTGGMSKPSLSTQPLVPTRPVNMSVPAQALPQREPRPRRTGTEPPRSLASKDASKKGAPIISSPRDAPDSHQIFVGGLPNHTSEADLRGVFGVYGNIIEVRVNQKNFAFVVFDNADSVQRIINEKDTIQLKAKYLNIELKRPSLPRGGGPRGAKVPIGSSASGKPRGGKPPKR